MSSPRAAGSSGSPRPPIPTPLARELADRSDGAGLAEVWHRLAAVAPEERPEDAALRADAWARVAAATGIPVDVRQSRPAAGAAVRPRVTSADGVRRRGRPAWATRIGGTARLRWAAAALALVAAGGGARAVGTVQVVAARGARTAVTLPDGSRAELNAGSTMRYARGFLGWSVGGARVRRVRLEGEAFFSVTRGGGSFAVETPEAHVTVLGTRFGVRARGGTRVVVEEGRVQVAPAGGRGVAGAPVVLAAGEETLVAAGAAPTPVRRAPVAQLVAWRRGGFAAVDQPLAAVLDELGRRYAVDVALRAPATAADRVTLYYPRPVGAETIVADVCAARGLRYRQTSRGYEVF
jgi:ferric-dicitrate binding protein FerR (iron transport regulator)